MGKGRGTHPGHRSWSGCLGLERLTSAVQRSMMPGLTQCQRGSSKTPSCPLEAIIGPGGGTLGWACAGVEDLWNYWWHSLERSWSSGNGKIQLQLL